MKWNYLPAPCEYFPQRRKLFHKPFPQAVDLVQFLLIIDTAPAHPFFLPFSKSPDIYRYQDIAIVCGDVELYGTYAQEIFDTFEVPLFLDARKDILFHPMTEFLRGVLLIAEQDFSYEAPRHKFQLLPGIRQRVKKNILLLCLLRPRQIIYFRMDLPGLRQCSIIF